MREPSASLALPQLHPARVDVWCATADLLDGALRGLRTVLDAGEQERADRFRFSRHRDSFVTAHIVLRLILGHYLAVAPGAVRLRSGPHGKPALDRPRGSDGPQFNVSHADGLAVIAVGADRAVGVDVEPIRPGFDYAPIVETFFGAGESAALQACDADAREGAFFRTWTRIEALAKAEGRGLAGARPAASADGWTVRSIAPAPGYAGAVAAAGAGWRAACQRWPPDVAGERAA